MKQYGVFWRDIRMTKEPLSYDAVQVEWWRLRKKVRGLEIREVDEYGDPPQGA